MRILLWSVTLLLLPAVAVAQTVLVRTGDHSGFTRIALDVPKGVTWDVAQSDRAVSIRLGGSLQGFDLDRAFDRIDRSRVRDIRRNDPGNELLVDLACTCTAQAFRHSDTMIVVDIRDKAEPDAKGGPKAENEVQEHRAGVPLFLPHRLTSTGLTFGAGHRDLTDIELPASPGIREAQERLLRQVGRAASQGLLTARQAVQQPDDPEIDIAVVPPASVHRKARTEPVNLTAVTSVDAATKRLFDQIERTLDGSVCLQNSRLDIRNWAAKDGGLANQVAPLRARLTGEFDEIDQDVVTGLVKLYLHFGFGAEARQYLSLRKERTDDDAIFASMARIVDQGFDPASGPFTGQAECDEDAALWALLSQARISPNQVFRAEAVRRAFDALPEHLRSHLGPILARRLIAGGHTDLARSITRIAERTDTGESEHFKLARAELDIATMQEERGEATLEEVLVEDGEMSPQALVRLVDRAWETDRTLTEEISDLAGLYSRELAGTDLAEDLMVTELRALAMANRHADAFLRLSEYGSRLLPETRAGAASDLFGMLTQRATSTRFLQEVYGTETPTFAEIDDSTVNGVAERLLVLGFPERAETILTTGAEGKAGRARRILRARIALETDRPRRAEADLLGLSGKDIDRLRALAREMAGDYSVAAELFRQVDEEQTARSSAWLAGDWQALARNSDDPLAAASLLALRETDNPAPEDIRLSHGRTLLETADTARETIGALLDHTQIEDALDVGE